MIPPDVLGGFFFYVGMWRFDNDEIRARGWMMSVIASNGKNQQWYTDDSHLDL